MFPFTRQPIYRILPPDALLLGFLPPHRFVDPEEQDPNLEGDLRREREVHARNARDRVTAAFSTGRISVQTAALLLTTIQHWQEGRITTWDPREGAFALAEQELF